MLAGFWLDYYEMGTVPLLTVTGVVIGTIVAFISIVSTLSTFVMMTALAYQCWLPTMAF
ncbi:hypothetical protein ACFLVC_04930 [Chloroflexota bacterium]